MTNTWAMTRRCGPKIFHFVLYTSWLSSVIFTGCHNIHIHRGVFIVRFCALSTPPRPQILPALDKQNLLVQNQKQEENTGNLVELVCVFHVNVNTYYIYKYREYMILLLERLRERVCWKRGEDSLLILRKKLLHLSWYLYPWSC